MKVKFLFRIFILFILAALLLGFGPLKKYWQNDTKISAQPFSQVALATAPTTAITESPRIEGKPIKLEISSLGINLPVVDGVYNAKTKTWNLSTNKTHYALMTPPANNKEGNTFIYGHNRRQVFAKLPQVKVGDKAIITTENNHTFTYVLRMSYTTDPYDDSLFSYEGPPMLTLQTCTGLWYQNRSLYMFDLSEVK